MAQPNPNSNPNPNLNLNSKSNLKEKKIMSLSEIEQLFAKATSLIKSNNTQKGINILKNLATTLLYGPAITLLNELEPTLEAKSEAKSEPTVEAKSERTLEYPHSFETTRSISSIVEEFTDIEKGTHLESRIESIIGRVVLIRTSSKKLYFYTLLIEGIEFQIMAQINSYAIAEDFYKITSQINRGDIIGVKGFIAKTKIGELSIIASNIVVLTPCLGVIPHSYYGIEDKEIRYNKRYLDMIVNPSVQEIFVKRHKIIYFIRKFLIEERNFIEIETPMMSGSVGGAAAKPFITYHNDLRQEMFLRIAPELYLKQCVIGGLPRVFELGKQFRNESIDLTHNPEFTSIELYEVGSDYVKLMSMTEDFLEKLALHINGTTKSVWMKTKIDFKGPYPRLDVMDTLEKQIQKLHNMPSFKLPLLDSPLIDEEYSSILSKLDIRLDPPHTLNRMMDKLIGTYVEPLCIQPTFLINHPQIMSPLAKPHRSLPNRTERFELFVNEKELCNAYTELNDPLLQKNIFAQIQKQKLGGDDEIPPSDDNFIQALEIGLPPTGGWGMGIDRLCMMLLNQDSIREVIMFPTRRT